MPDKRKSLKIRWAFDPFADHPETWDRAMEVLELLHDTRQAQITPTYVVGYDVIDWISNMTPNQGRDLGVAVRKATQAHLKKLDKEHIFQDSEVLQSTGYSRRTDAATMVEGLEQGNDDLLVINTHARKGLDRFFLGSFAESTLLKSKKPILFVSPNTQKIKQLDRVFFPTDFAEGSESVFEAFLESPVNLASEIVLYSKVAHPASVLASSTSTMFGGGAISLEKYLGDVRAERLKKAEKWKAKAEKFGVKTEIIVDDGPSHTVDSLLSFAKETRCDLIAMPSFASTVETLLAGSRAREVLRASPVPVLVWHVGKERQKKTAFTLY